MRPLSAALVALLLPALAAGKPAPRAAARRPPPAAPFIRGVAFGHYSDITRAELDRRLGEIAGLGATHVSFVVSWSTPDVRSTRLAPRKDYTTPDRVVLRMLARARARGLRTLLFPIIDVRTRKPLEWRGTIKPPSWDAWWRSYRRFVMHYARLAARGKADIYCVGSELVSTEGMRDRWRRLIRRVRRTYRGKLLYSANWDHYEPVTFWPAVDLVGLTAYYAIARTREAPLDEMVAAWRKVRAKLAGWARRTGRPFVFTELGYPNLDGAAMNPWDYTTQERTDPAEQARAFRAFARAWAGARELGGVFVWDWYGKGGPGDRRYTPRGKPAEEVIRRWFRGMAAGKGTPPAPRGARARPARR